MPDLLENVEASKAEFFRDYRGIPPVELEQTSQPLIQMAANGQFQMALDTHQLLHHVKAQGRQADAAAAIFRAHFTEGKLIGRLDVLLAITEAVGLDPAEAERALVPGQHRAIVRADIQRAEQLGLRAEPFFYFQISVALSGAQDVA